MTVTAVYEDGVFKPKEPVSLEEHVEVELDIKTLTPPATEPDEEDATGWKTADELIGFIKGGPKGPIGRDHDEYLYRK